MRRKRLRNILSDQEQGLFEVWTWYEFFRFFQEFGIEKISLEENILTSWSQESPDVEVRKWVSEYKGALKLRHWLAHGRYWKPRLGRVGGYDPITIFDICNGLLNSLGLV